MNFQRTNNKISLLEDYYNHFDEDKRLKRRHGIVEYNTNMNYIHTFLGHDKSKKILDIGAGTGSYSIPLYNEGYNVLAVELVKSNILKFKKNNSNVDVIEGDARNLPFIESNSFDLIILFGPMYHLLKKEDKIKALLEAKRIIKEDGFIFVSYYMNDYAILKYGFIDGNIKKSIEEGRIDNEFHVINKEDDLYSMVRIKDINDLNLECGLKSIKRFASDGGSDYIRTTLNKLSEEEFDLFLKYNLTICENQELLGASSHVVDILKK